MEKGKRINLGIGFATGRRSFQKVLKTNVYNWEESGLTEKESIHLNLFVAYDLKYSNTKSTDYTNVSENVLNLIDDAYSSRVSPFYNPPAARGEYTFLSTCLGERKVLRVPCYTFHDGFSTYRNLMNGVLPIKLKYIQADSEPIISRFYHACIGWIRYKPLLLYITQREHYEEKIEEIREQITASLPSICAYFGRDDFMNVTKELERYNRNVKKHYQQFLEMQQIWTKISKFLTTGNPKNPIGR